MNKTIRFDLKEAVKYLDLVLCDFEGDCDFCSTPMNGTYCKLYHVPEDVTETEYYICGNCTLVKAVETKKSSDEDEHRIAQLEYEGHLHKCAVRMVYRRSKCTCSQGD